jgi:hypothetical protein
MMHDVEIETSLKVIICDADERAAELLQRTMEKAPGILSVRHAKNTSDAKSMIGSGECNAIFMDPISIGLDDGSSFIFEIRKKYLRIVFVLYIDRAIAERNRAIFYHGERQRFSHYFSLDKGTPLSAFSDELNAVIDMCQFDLNWGSSTGILRWLRDQAAKLSDKFPESRAFEEAARQGLFSLNRRTLLPQPRSERSVFLSHRFAEKEYVKGLSRLLEASGFEIITGRDSNTYVSLAVIERIRQASLFMCLMTRADAKADGTFTTSPWLLEEKGVALAFGKPLVLMVEEGVSDFGELQGDWQRIHFGAKGFLTAALEAVAQLKSYRGDGEITALPANASATPRLNR